MKRFLSITAAVLAIGVTPAQAMDYVKCEAMNKAAGRLRVSSRQAREQVHDDYNRTRKAACVHQGDVRTMSAKEYGAETARWSACSSQWHAANWDALEQKKAAASAVHTQRLAQVQKDYEAAGCY